MGSSAVREGEGTVKLQFKVQQYQTDAVDAVVECFAGQPEYDGVSYRIAPRSPEAVGRSRVVRRRYAHGRAAQR